MQVQWLVILVDINSMVFKMPKPGILVLAFFKVYITAEKKWAASVLSVNLPCV